MSDIFTNFDSNGAYDDSQDFIMASPSQNSPLANSNSNSVGITSTNTASGGGGSTQNVNSGNSCTNGTGGGSAGGGGKASGGTENQPVSRLVGTNIFKKNL